MSSFTPLSLAQSLARRRARSKVASKDDDDDDGDDDDTCCSVSVRDRSFISSSAALGPLRSPVDIDAANDEEEEEEEEA